MGTYLQQYGAGEERRNRIITRIILSVVGVVVVGIVGYFIFQNYSEKKVATSFLDKINARQYREAYQQWGCTTQHPCPNYDFGRFMEDWGPSKSSSAWKIANVEGCRTFVTVNVQAQGSELESLAVQRSDNSLGYAPAPECQERKWRWKQFFQRVLGGGTPPPPSAPKS
jgi:hypothetical protein